MVNYYKCTTIVVKISVVNVNFILNKDIGDKAFVNIVSSEDYEVIIRSFVMVGITSGRCFGLIIASFQAFVS